MKHSNNGNLDASVNVDPQSKALICSAFKRVSIKVNQAAIFQKNMK